MAFKKFDEASHGFGPAYDTFTDPANEKIEHPDNEKIESFIDDVRYLCDSYGYKFNHEISYKSMQDPQSWSTIISAILKMRVIAR